MRHITILILKNAILGSIEGPRQILTEVNSFLKSSGGNPLFEIHLAGVTHETKLNNGLYNVQTNTLISDIDKTDLIIIPAVNGDPGKEIENNKEFIPWITEQYEKGAEVASLCVGAFILAATGLINGKNCATHWAAADYFRMLFPEVNLVTEKIITDENGIYTSGGAFSYLNLILYLIEKYAGRDLAVYCAKSFQIDIHRDSQSQFIIFKGQKEHEDEPIKKAQEYIENNFKEKITVDGLATMFCLGRRNFERRFKKATANTVVEYMQRVKIEAAKKTLESSHYNVNEVMYEVGYTDPKSFRNTFKKITGLSPVQYRNKFNQMMPVR